MRKLMITFLIAIVVLSACGSGESPQSTVTRVATKAPPATAVDTPQVEPTEPPPTAARTEPAAQPTSTSAATSVAPTDTPAPTSPPEPTPTTAATPTPVAAATAAPEPTATEAPAPVAEGRLSFRNSLAVADQLVLTMNGVAAPPSGSVYEGWLIADDGVTEISTGIFEVAADGTVDYAWSSPAGETLIAKYASFAVTVEPADDADPAPSSTVVFWGQAEPQILDAARRVFAANAGEPATPRNISYGQGLLKESQVAKDHTVNAFNAAAIGAFGETLVHAEHVINIIEGTAGPRFADYNGDGRAENPGDGFGTLAYARQIAASLPAAGSDLGSVEGVLIAIQDKAEEILASPDLATAQPLVNEFKALGEQLAGQAAPVFYSAAQAAVSYRVIPAP